MVTFYPRMPLWFCRSLRYVPLRDCLQFEAQCITCMNVGRVLLLTREIDLSGANNEPMRNPFVSQEASN